MDCICRKDPWKTETERHAEYEVLKKNAQGTVA